MHVGVAVIMAMTVLGVAFMLHRIQGDGGQRDIARLSAFMAGAFNLLVVLPLLEVNYPRLKEIDLSEAFPDVISITHVLEPKLINLHGLILSSESVFRALSEALIDNQLTGNEFALKQIGDPVALKRVMSIITEAATEKEKEEDEDEGKENTKLGKVNDSDVSGAIVQLTDMSPGKDKDTKNGVDTNSEETETETDADNKIEL